MATVIDQLVVELGLDPSKFTQGQKDAINAFKQSNEAAVTFGKSIEAQGAKHVDFFSTLKRQAVELLALFLGGRGIKEFVSYITDLDAGTSRLAKTMNMSANELSVWQGAFEQIGGSAQSASSALSGLSGDVNRFFLTGQSAALPALNALGIGFKDVNGHIRTAGQLYVELNKAVQGMDPARAAALLSMIPGMNQDSINLLLESTSAFGQYMRAAQAAGGTTTDSAKAARDFQRDLANLDRAASNLGRTVLTAFGPQLTAAMRQFADAIKDLKYLGLELYDSMRDWMRLLPRSVISTVFGPKTLAELDAPSAADAARLADAKKALADGLRGRSAGTAGAPAAQAAPSDQEAYIRRAAIARGIDPDVAVQVAKSEGLGGAYVGDRGSSFGPFQLHYGGMANGGMAVSGLGDVFTKSTGLDAKDPSTWQAQVDFALDQAKRGGWGAWHGFKGAPFTGIGAPGAARITNNRSGDSSHSVSISVAKIEVHSSKADASEVAGAIPEALKRMNWAASANYGQQG